MWRVDEICDRFEAAWKAGENPSIADYVADWPAEDTSNLIRELLNVEWELLRKAQQKIDPDTYCEQFAELSDYIKTAFSGDVSTVMFGNESADVAQNTSWQEQQGLDVDGRIDGLELYAEGGLGEVYVAHDNKFRRKVAVKRIKPKHLSNIDSARRFQLEAEITGRLEHPGTVPVHGMGHDDKGQPFYVMKFIRGDTFQSRIDWFHEQTESLSPNERSLEFRKLLNHFLTAGHAIEYAHSRGVIHRDIKPANIMLGRYGETLVVDWGWPEFLTTRMSRLSRRKRVSYPSVRPTIRQKP